MYTTETKIEVLLRVVIESPLRGAVPSWCPTWAAPVFERWGRWRNHRYALACMRDSLRRGEAPYASHVMFDRRGLLNDAAPDERIRGMRAGFLWGQAGALRAVYCDRGITDGMRAGIASAPAGQAVTYRWLYAPRNPATVARVHQLEQQAAFRRGGVEC